MPGGISYIGDLTIQEDGGEITSQAIGDKALKTTCADADTLEVSSSGKLQVKEAGSSKANGIGRNEMSKYAGFWVKGALSATDSAGGVFSIQNSYGTDMIIDRILIQVTTGASDSACRIDIGTASDATTSAATLIDELNVSDIGIYDNITDKGSAGTSRLKFGNSQYLNASKSAGATSGLVGTFAVHMIDIN
jgi:hypothetical protein